MNIKTKPFDIFEELKTEQDIDGFIAASIEDAKDDTDPKHLIHALEIATRARGMLQTSKDADITRAGLYRALSGESDPRISTLCKVANSLGYRVTLTAIDSDFKRV
jgi:probable addiction module antidote protein